VVARHFPQKNSIFQDNNVLIHRAQKVMMEYRAIFIINAKTKIKGDHLSGKPGNVREFDSFQ